MESAGRLLEVSSVAAEVRLNMDFAYHYKTSDLYKQNKVLVNQLSQPEPGTSYIDFPTEYSQSIIGQFKACLWKHWLTYWRSPDYNLVRFSFTLFTALLLGSIFWKIGTIMGDANTLRMVIGAMYTAVMFVGINNCATVQPIVLIERTVLYRERAAGCTLQCHMPLLRGFVPVKNMNGMTYNTPDTAKLMLLRLHSRWVVTVGGFLTHFVPLYITG